jgi:predicted Zn-ribbon and HTH transcriptional regulator
MFDIENYAPPGGVAGKRVRVMRGVDIDLLKTNFGVVSPKVVMRPRVSQGLHSSVGVSRLLTEGRSKKVSRPLRQYFKTLKDSGRCLSLRPALPPPAYAIAQCGYRCNSDCITIAK